MEDFGLMYGMDIGIDLGTATVLVYDSARGIVLREPSVVAVNTRTGDILAVGDMFIPQNTIPGALAQLGMDVDGIAAQLRRMMG